MPPFPLRVEYLTPTTISGDAVGFTHLSLSLHGHRPLLSHEGHRLLGREVPCHDYHACDDKARPPIASMAVHRYLAAWDTRGTRDTGSNTRTVRGRNRNTRKTSAADRPYSGHDRTDPPKNTAARSTQGNFCSS